MADVPTTEAAKLARVDQLAEEAKRLTVAALNIAQATMPPFVGVSPGADAICKALDAIEDLRTAALAQAAHQVPEPVDEVVQRAAFVAEAKRRGWAPGNFMLGAYAGWLALAQLRAAPRQEKP